VEAGLADPQADLKAYYGKMLKPAADFLVDGGKVGLGWNHETIRPPYTQQERWEEQGGHSPSTTAATIAGLVAAGDIAALAGDAASALSPLSDHGRRLFGQGRGADVHHQGRVRRRPILLRLNKNDDPNNTA
jgi:glucoamylase